MVALKSNERICCILIEVQRLFREQKYNNRSFKAGELQLEPQQIISKDLHFYTNDLYKWATFPAVMTLISILNNDKSKGNSKNTFLKHEFHK